MKLFAFLFCVVSVGFFGACTSTQQLASNISPPSVLKQHPLPPVPKSILRENMRLDMQLYVAEDGSVKIVRFLTGSGDEEWDSQAKAVIAQWQYSPARLDNRPIGLWLHQVARVEYEDPFYIALATILCSTPEEAESVYAALEEGKDFDELAEQHSVVSKHSSSNALSKVDVHSYPKNVQQVLLELDQNVFSKPVKYGEHYAIFKRL